MDLEQEIENHLAWIDGIASLLDAEEFSEADMQKITSHNTCELGHWLSAEGLELYKGMPEFRQLVDSHEVFHKLAGELIAAIQSGEESKAVEVEQDFIRMSQEVVGYLQRLQEVSNST
ncbi:MAG: CZB domain-containing protein [Gammaproteobacteria bacterium]|nr:CZB domain-containing protein [Gammaproteobacteria bacterium]